MSLKIQYTLGVAALLIASHASAQVTFYEGEGFRGRAFTTEKSVKNFKRYGFNDHASSIVVENGYWQVCEDIQFRGDCVVLRPGSYDSLSRFGFNDMISSARPVKGRARQANEGPEPLTAPNYEYRRRPKEAVFEAPVTSVHAVLGAPTERCWVEHQQVNEPNKNNTNIGGAIAGALIGGVLGHQVGGGRGKDLATAGGAVAGAAVGSTVGRNGTTPTDKEVRRCETTPNTKPEYWDVTYVFHGVEHRVQMTAPPGKWIAVNENGEPRQ